MALLNWLKFSQGRRLISALGKVHCQVGLEFDLLGMLCDFFFHQPDRLLIGLLGFAGITGRPAVRVPEIAPVVEMVGAKFDCLFKRGHCFLIMALEKTQGGKVVINICRGFYGERLLKSRSRIGRPAPRL